MSEGRSWDLDNTLDKANPASPGHRPPDSVTVTEARLEKQAEGEDISESTMRRRLRKAVEMGYLAVTVTPRNSYYHPPVEEEATE